MSVDLRECINKLHDRLREIETKFKIPLTQEDKDLFYDLKREIVLNEDTKVEVQE